MKAVLSLDDFSVSYPRFDVLRRLKSHFSDFKISLFTIPYCPKEDWGPSVLRNENLKEIKSNLDWIQIIPHGYAHEGYEMRKMSYEQFLNTILLAQDSFEKDGLPYEKGFKAPHWQWNDDVVKALNDIGWWGAITPVKDMPRPKRFYEYDFAINEPFWESDKEVLKLHGHLYGTKNDIDLCYNNLMLLPKNTKFEYVTNFLENGN